MTHKKMLILCECCALKLTNDDESGCRDFHRHTHGPLSVPGDTAITQGPHEWDGTLALDCHGHEDGVIYPDQVFWVAESFPALCAPDGDPSL